MVPQGRRETLVMLGARVLLVLLGNPAPLGLLAKGGSQVPMDPQEGQAPWGLEGPLDVSGLRVFQGFPVLWVNQGSWDLLDSWVLLVLWGPLASQG